ncbi:MAG: hypothetical protein RL318_1523 [Fibrobacterota bacterium]|jgi:protein arginine kinase activator
MLNDPVCLACGFPWSEFLREHHLGCPVCYEVFRARLAPMLQKYHRTRLEQPPAGNLREQVRAHRREAWQRRQDAAVAREDYEEAARMRGFLEEDSK